VSLFIKHFAPRNNVLEEAVSPPEAGREGPGRADDQVKGKTAVLDRLVDAHGLLDLVPGLHHHQ
jgi:hypothetical protein